MKLQASSNTLLKQLPVQSIELKPHQIKAVQAGTELPLRAIARKETQGHLYITLDGMSFGGFNSWYIYPPHWIGFEEQHPQHKEVTLEPPENKGTPIIIPGLGKRYTGNPIDGCANFLWGEATANGTRIPESIAIAKNIIRIAKSLEIIRADYGNRAVTINSWYRPPAVNRAIGGASQSRHLSGDAVDFNIEGINPWDIYRRYDKTWSGGLAAVDRGSFRFCHIDGRPYRSRWAY